ncbi:tetratricopeptide repeat protein [Lentibacillus saliphilus]|uniref:tetratricopeptide repeat protein n=1 Tax=Lentibacillus saliphilus TaxID=2737028 RepID=UPI001C31066D|nr:tetratricopeptide repeat protein [Lentibacillus saliphilus]
MKVIKQRLQRAFTFLEQGNLKQAEILYLECLDGIDDQASLLFEQALHGLGYVKSEQGHFSEARDLYLRLIDLAVKKGDQENEAIAYHQLAMVERMAGRYDEALYNFSREQMVYDAKYPHFHLGYAANFYERGYIHFIQGAYFDAEHFIQASLDHALQSKDQIAIGCAWRCLGDIAVKTGEKQAALMHYEQAKHYFQQAAHSKAVSEIEETLSKLTQ